MLQGSSPRIRAVAVVSTAAALAASAAAEAAPPAPGAPGARHTWAPADKHGFATAHQLGGNAYATLRAASLTEVYYPDLSTPAFRGLQFAVGDGRGRLERETVDDDPAHVEPVAPGVRARVEPLDGALGFRQVTETRRWKLSKTWITDPARATVLARVRFTSKTGRKLKLYVLADPAPGDDGNDDRAATRGHDLVAWDDTAASAVAAAPGFTRTSSGYRGTESDPWQDLQDGRLRGWDATAPGNVVQGAATRLDGVRKRDLTLAIGFGADAAAADATARASLGRGFGHAARRFAGGWRSYLRSLDRAPDSVRHSPALRRLYEQSLMVLAASEDKVERGASIAAPNMPWVWGTLTLEKHEFSGPYHLVWPRDFYHVATAQKAAGDDEAATRLLEYLWRVQKPDGSWWQNTRVDGTEYWTNLQLDEVALPIVLAWWLDRRGGDDWPHIQRAADFIVANGPQTKQERWENQEGWSPNTIATEIAGLICAADVARGERRPGACGVVPGDRGRVAGAGRGLDGHDERPVLRRPVLRPHHEGRQSGRREHVQPRRQLPAARGRAGDRRQLLPRPGAVRRQGMGRPGRAQLAGGRGRAARVGHAERPDVAPLHVRRLRRDGDRRRLGHLPDRRAADARARVAAARG